MTDESQRNIDTLRGVLQLLNDRELSNPNRQAVAEALQALEDLSRALEDVRNERHRFVSHVSHELRVPMTSILGYTDLLRKGLFGEVNEKQFSILDVIRNNVERMADLVSNLSDLSKIETGRLSLEFGGVSLKDVVDEVVHNLQPHFAEKSQSLEVDVSPVLPQLYADRDRLVQVLTSLLDNANRYTPEHGEIRLRAGMHERFVRVNVEDNGIGIDEENQAHLFEQFFRSDDISVREQPGWGLSLCVVKGLVEMMGGEVGVVSDLGQGSTFWLTLPALPT